jgi:hypothetical protein
MKSWEDYYGPMISWKSWETLAVFMGTHDFQRKSWDVLVTIPVKMSP